MIALYTDLPCPIPEELFNNAPYDTDEETRARLIGLWWNCADEVTSFMFVNKNHGELSTYRAGCDGPLCAAANRAYARKYSGHKPAEKYLWEEIVLEIYQVRLDEIDMHNNLVRRLLLCEGLELPGDIPEKTIEILFPNHETLLTKGIDSL